MKIGIVSDSHGHHINVLRAVDVLNEEKVQYVLHAGDIISPVDAQAFSNVRGAQFIAVFGNCDGEKIFLRSTIEDFGGQIHNQPYVGQIGDKNIFMTHIPNSLDAFIESGKYDVVIYGHTHKRDIRNIGSSLVINPGELTSRTKEENSLVILQLDDMSYEAKSINN